MGLGDFQPDEVQRRGMFLRFENVSGWKSALEAPSDRARDLGPVLGSERSLPNGAETARKRFERLGLGWRRGKSAAVGEDTARREGTQLLEACSCLPWDIGRRAAAIFGGGGFPSSPSQALSSCRLLLPVRDGGSLDGIDVGVRGQRLIRERP